MKKAAYPDRSGCLIHQIPAETGEDTPPRKEHTIFPIEKQHAPRDEDPLTELVRRGARRLIEQAVEAELEMLLAKTRHLKDEAGRQRVVRNGHLPERQLQNVIGPVTVKVPRVHDRKASKEKRIRFSSSILPKYMRRTRSLDALIPWLYLKGVSTREFSEALSALLGPDAPGLSQGTVSRLKAAWQEDLMAWKKRNLKGKRYLYVWADGVYFNVRNRRLAGSGAFS